MRILLHFIVLFIFLGLCSHCKKEGRTDHLNTSAPAPEQVSDIQTIATPGGALVTYKVPDDPNFSYVKAVYEIRPSIFREAKSSQYTDTLILIGFGDTLTHEVKLYSIGKNEKASDPISISVKPDESPLQSVYKSLKLNPALGGVTLSFGENESQAPLSLVLLMDTTGLGTWKTIATFYTGAVNGEFSERGFDTTEFKFAAYVRDRWNNLSDTVINTVIPLFEQKIDNSSFNALVLPNDNVALRPDLGVDNVIDGITNSQTSIYASQTWDPLPQWFTIDLGKKVIISRFKEFQRGGRSKYAYNRAVPKKFQLWGCESLDTDGSWDNWILLGTFHSFKPSGLPLDQVSQEDIDYAVVNGEDFELENPSPPVRYIRFKTLENYGAGGQVVICELEFWGLVVK